MYNRVMEKREEGRRDAQKNNGAPVNFDTVYGGAAYSLLIIIYLVLSLIAGAITSSLPEGSEASRYISLLVSPIAIAATAAIYFRVTRQSVKKILPVKCKPHYIPMALLLIFGLLFSLNFLNDYIVKFFELFGYERRSSPLPDMSGWRVVPVMIVVAVIPAIAEEIAFRGILLNGTEEGVGSPLAIVFCGLCFSLYHGSVEQTLYQFICGCLFAFIAVRSRSVTPSVIMHFLNNAVIIVLCACGCTDAATGELSIPFAANIALTAISAVCLVGAVVWLFSDKTDIKKRTKGGVGQFFLGAAVGLIAMAALWISNLVVCLR